MAREQLKQRKTQRKRTLVATLILCAMLGGVIASLSSCAKTGLNATGYTNMVEEGLGEDSSENESAIAFRLNGLASEIRTSNMPKESPVNILLVGTDASRSDTMLLLSYDPNSQSIQMASFMRDMYVDLGEYGSSRINNAISKGGPDFLVEVLVDTFDVDIDYWAVVGFEGFAKVVDILGGISIELSQSEARYVNSRLKEDGNYSNYITVSSSSIDTYILNGVQALSHVRNRSVGGTSDFGRVERQQDFIGDMVPQLIDSVSFSNIIPLAMAVFNVIETNIPVLEAVSLARKVMATDGISTDAITIPVAGGYSYATIGGASVLKIDDVKNKNALSEFFNQEGEAKTPVLAASGSILFNKLFFGGISICVDTL